MKEQKEMNKLDADLERELNDLVKAFEGEPDQNEDVDNEQPDPGASEEEELLAMAWVVLANAYEGNWTQALRSWQKSAVKWRDDYHDYLASLPR